MVSYNPPVKEKDTAISEDLLADIVARLKMPLSAVTPSPRRGISNTIFEAQSPTGKVVIKFSGIGELGVHRKEAQCAALAEKHGVRTPKVLAVGNSRKYSFHVSQFIEGKDVDTLSEAKRIPCWQEVGRQIAKLHRVQAIGFTDEFEAGAISPGEATLEFWLDHAIEACGTPSARAILGVDRSSRLAPAFFRLSKAKFKPVICHGGLHAGNFRVDPLGGVWLIDWGEAIGHSPLRDIADLFALDATESDRKAFFAGYGKEFSPQDTELRLMIVARLAMRAIWLAERRNTLPECAPLLTAALQRLDQYL